MEEPALVCNCERFPYPSDNERDVLGADATRKYGCVQIASNHEFHREIVKASVLLHRHQHPHDCLVIQFGHDARAADEPFTARGVTS